MDVDPCQDRGNGASRGKSGRVGWGWEQCGMGCGQEPQNGGVRREQGDKGGMGKPRGAGPGAGACGRGPLASGEVYSL